MKTEEIKDEWKYVWKGVIVVIFIPIAFVVALITFPFLKIGQWAVRNNIIK